MSKHNRVNSRFYSGFTIVELLVVIVVIGILAAITVVSYTGITQRAVVASIQSDLSNASQQLKLYNIEYGVYPSTIDGSSNCPTGPTDTKYCLKPSGNDSFTDYDVDNSTSNKYFHIMVRNGTTCYEIDNNSSPTLNSSCAYSPTVTIGTQVWMKSNVNVGTRISGVGSQSNNSILEKYCWNNDENNCTNRGGLYQWGEAVQYQNGASNTTSPSPVFSGNIQGICPVNFHIPTDTEWTTLESYLVDNQGTKLKQGGSSRFNGVLGGELIFGSGWADEGVSSNFWTSTQSTAWNAWYRNLWDSSTTVGRSNYTKNDGYSVRCMKN